MNASGGHVTDLLGAWALDACDAEETAAVTAHVHRCAACAQEATTLRRAAAALATLTGRADADTPDSYAPNADTADADTADTGAGSPPPAAQVLTAALARRRPAPSVPAFAAPFAAAAGLFESALAELDGPARAAPSPVRGWTIGDLVTHVAATDGLLAAAIGIPADPPVDPRQDVVAHSEALIAHARTQPAEAEYARALWRDGVDAIAARLRAEPDLAGRSIQVGGIGMSVADQLTVRAFETWIHARDIAHAVGLRLPDPLAHDLHVMSDLAARLLDELSTLDIPGVSEPPAGTVELTLTGPGGGSWLVRVGAVGGAEGAAHAGGAEGAARTPPAAEITLGTVEFCLLVGDRRRLDDLDVVITGDDPLGRRLLALAPALSGP